MDTQTIKLYIDRGDGFEADCHFRDDFNTDLFSSRYDLAALGAIERIKLVPADTPVILALGDFRIMRPDGSDYGYSPYGLETNAAVTHPNALMFGTDHPHIILNVFRRKLQSIEIELRYLAVGGSALDQLIKSQGDALYRTRWELERANRHQRRRVAMLSERLGHRITDLETRLAQKGRGAESLFSGRLPGRLTDNLLSGIRLLRTDTRRLPEKIPLSLAYLQRPYRTIARSGIFDDAYYRGQCTAAAGRRMDGISDYLRSGARKGLKPCALFDTRYYQDRYPDVVAAGTNPLVHYLEGGAGEGRNPNAFFDSAHYLENNRDVAEAGMNPLAHYLFSGSREGRDPGPYFNTTYYLERHPEVKRLGSNPLAHFLDNGSKKGYWPTHSMESLGRKPLISIVCPVYNVAATFLHRCIRSVIGQYYPRWELCLVDDGSDRDHVKPILEAYAAQDPRIRVKLLENNRGTAHASGIAAGMADGEYLTFLDHDDELVGDALYQVVLQLNRGSAEVLYSDEGIIDANGKSLSWICKPGFSPELLLSHNYMTHLLVVKKECFHAVGGFDDTREGAQDYDLALKLSEVSSKIVHIPRVLYYWRQIDSSTSANPEAKPYADESGRRAVEAALGRREVAADVIKNEKAFYYRVKRHIRSSPRVTIIIPFRDQPGYLERCIRAIRQKTTYDNYEILGINNRSAEQETLDLMADLEKSDSGITFLDYNGAFNFSAIVNYGVGMSQGEHIVLMNNDIEVINADWLEALLEHSQRPSIGAVGAKLYYPDGTIQHAGIILGIAGFAGHGHRNFPGDSSGHYNRLKCTQNVTAVTGALMMVKRRIFEASGGFDAVHLAVALNDVDFCLRLTTMGQRNVFTPFCEATHYESASRGYEVSLEKRERFNKEIRIFQRRWKDMLSQGDPYYNRHLTLSREDYSLNSEQRKRFESLNKFKPAG